MPTEEPAIALKLTDFCSFVTLTVVMKPEETPTEYQYTVYFEPADEGGFGVTCPALPGLVTEGDTLEEAREMAADAIRAYLESLRKDGAAIR